MNFSFSKTKGATEGGKFLGAGIHKATFKGIDFDTVESKNGDEFNVMVLNLDVEGYGPYTHNFFEPQSDERKEMQWGLSPSQVDHFLIAVRQILDALDPQLVVDLDEGKISLEGSFKKIVAGIKKLTDSHIEDEIQIKLLPQSNGFNSIPSFVAGISKNGNLTIKTRFIGHDLTLNDRELKMIEAAKTAAPTDMKSKDTSVADKLREDLENDDNEIGDDLPF